MRLTADRTCAEPGPVEDRVKDRVKDRVEDRVEEHPRARDA
ncbi:hypothetical protein [Streptomyces regalis]|nr:hypothetical protein [Streptomyces regalis]